MVQLKVITRLDVFLQGTQNSGHYTERLDIDHTIQVGDLGLGESSPAFRQIYMKMSDKSWASEH